MKVRYQLLDFTRLTKAEQEKTLNAYGEAGWVLVCVVVKGDERTAYLKWERDA